MHLAGSPARFTALHLPDLSADLVATGRLSGVSGRPREGIHPCLSRNLEDGDEIEVRIKALRQADPGAGTAPPNGLWPAQWPKKRTPDPDPLASSHAYLVLPKEIFRSPELPNSDARS